ncbi:glycosyltransferase family protein [Spartinivicinus poritis]|uniref:Glycosyltransferase n=1 Tax=Spartinivicinus poritis TaxID=2994640 RepID=A0ABT5UAV6_9GAMM|nr:glycosyltransferase [Spartinivicinus sp. A2-2]MDE1463442.1 glycosyltransferase [Spartinivicinus sp. A2-2]
MPQSPPHHAKVLIYSHDTYGLGHLRRCRTIAHSLVKQYKGISILILSGSALIGRFEFKARVDFVRIPGVIKLYNGDYTSMGLHIDLEETLSIRESIIFNTANSFQPDVFIVDKEPLGLKGEVKRTLQHLHQQGVHTVLGLRDVLDAPELLKKEWQHKGISRDVLQQYDDIWIYGPQLMGNPLQGLAIADEIEQRGLYTGFLHRHLPQAKTEPLNDLPKQYLLVTPGGGGDGVEMVDWVISAYEQAEAELPWPAVIIAGPFMNSKDRHAFENRVKKLSRVTLLTFISQLEHVMANAQAVVAMGGYNTFCEILSFNQRALFIPRKEPRLEQFIRAKKAAELGWATMLDPDQLTGGDAPLKMVGALKALPSQARPYTMQADTYLSGIATIGQRFNDIMTKRGVSLEPNLA